MVYGFNVRVHLVLKDGDTPVFSSMYIYLSACKLISEIEFLFALYL